MIVQDGDFNTVSQQLGVHDTFTVSAAGVGTLADFTIFAFPSSRTKAFVIEAGALVLTFFVAQDILAARTREALITVAPHFKSTME